ncbi:uncharacterized protein LOC120359508 [Solenopsis invicta]|uniref:uncharacterized protein LOC120359508 n=1 Tax=Solenopsis invicta TaxID=13686 RepID=UPI00193D3308|nr:uncharacterized protein LOC120359508 [Solenopsis invicta]XP_039313133.1 uncharacterized protein LOC120359508 [Solenopsis invicta]XP_039313134.1 uncharacterized protein LOC120359508 [Solenopsis invicta]
MMSKRFKKHISELSNRQFCRRITSETEKVMRCIFENIKDNDDYDDRDEETRKELLDLYEEQCTVTTESLHRPGSSKQDPFDRFLQHQNQCENKFEEIVDIFDEENCHIDINCLDSDDNPIDSDIECFNNTDDTTVVTPYLPEYENVMSETECSTKEHKNKEIENTKEFLRNWKLRNNICHTAVTELLHHFKLHSCFQTLPIQSKTLMNTPRNKVNIISMVPGRYIHIGLQKGITETILNTNKELFLSGIEISIFIDGIPLFKSSASLWPIVGCVKNTSDIFLIGAYYGPEKPYDSNLYLSATVNDIKDVCQNGITIEGLHYNCRIVSVIADAPAKSYILNVKGHCGYYSCTKCHVKGKYAHRRVYMLNNHEQLRNDFEFKNKTDPNYHLGHSILTDIPDFDIVNQIPLEYMHLICLGVMRKLLYLWLSKSKQPYSLNAQSIQRLSVLFENIASFVPNEFSRKPRSLQLVKYFKATEYRLLLLYTGPVVLKNILDKNLFNHFLVLHVSVRILCSDDYSQYIEYAGQLLEKFVDAMPHLYHESFVSHNVHGLIHVIQDVKTFGPLDNYSAFKYENFLQHLKRVVKKYAQPLEQLYNRYHEIKSNVKRTDYRTTKLVVSESQNTYCILPNGKRAPLYTEAISINYRFRVNTINDNCCILTNGDIVQITKFSYDFEKEELIICGKRYERKDNLFTIPCESSLLQIYVVSQLSQEKMWPLNKIKNKMFVLPYKNKFVVLPLLHNEHNTEKFIL